MNKYTEGDYIKKIRELNRKITHLETNWNELKKWLEEEYKYVPTYYCRMIKIISNKMQELEEVK